MMGYLRIIRRAAIAEDDFDDVDASLYDVRNVSEIERVVSYFCLGSENTTNQRYIVLPEQLFKHLKVTLIYDGKCNLDISFLKQRHVVANLKPVKSQLVSLIAASQMGATSALLQRSKIREILDGEYHQNSEVKSIIDGKANPSRFLKPKP
ncbi:MAG: hypothetical protein ACOH5I_21815 [Oligoflexus sp.]